MNLGQNFLVNEKILRKEVEIASIGKGDIVLEIGAGSGNLTKLLAKKAKRVIAIEIDRRFKDKLNKIARKFKNVKIIYGNALEINFPRFDKVVSNLPFITSLPIIFKILDYNFDDGVIILQYRMAKRICTKVGNSGYSRISVMIQRLADVEFIEKIPREAFKPIPKVNAAMIKIKKKTKFNVKSEDYFRKFLDYAFMFNKWDDIIKNLTFFNGKKKISERINKNVIKTSPIEFGRLANEFYKEKIFIPEIPKEIKRKVQKSIDLTGITVYNIKKELIQEAKEEVKREFKRVGIKDTIGVRFPEIKKVIYKYKWKPCEVAKLLWSNTFEERIGAIYILRKCQNFRTIMELANKVNDWATCDAFATNLKINEKFRIKFSKKLISSKNPFKVRLALLLTRGLNKEIQEKIRKKIRIKNKYVTNALKMIKIEN